jgi:hypothetical protein
VQVDWLFKNNLDAERSRVANTFSSPDIMRGFVNTVSRGTRLNITPGGCRWGMCACAQHGRVCLSGAACEGARTQGACRHRRPAVTQA